MAKAMSITVFKCDGCGRFIEASDPDSTPVGFHGTVKEVHPDGDSETTPYYAHHDRCIKAAVMNVLGIA